MKRLWWFACVVAAVAGLGACGNPRGGMGAGDDTGGHDDAASDTLPVIDTAVIPGMPDAAARAVPSARRLRVEDMGSGLDSLL